MADNTLLPANELLLALINRDNGSALTLSLVDLGAPAASQEVGKNTAVEVTAKAGSGYSGAVTVDYNRLNLQTDIADVATGVTLRFGLGNAESLADFVPEINAALGINLGADDYIDDDLPEFAGTPNEVQPASLDAAAGSLAYIGSLAFEIAGNDIALSTVITVTNLSGLTYEAPAG